MIVRDVIRVRDVMHRDVVTVRPEAPIREAAEKLEILGPEAALLPVVENGRIVGAVAWADIAAHRDTMRGGADIEGITAGPDRLPPERVEQVMQPGLSFCYEDQYLSEARRVMEQDGYRHIPVLGRDRHLVGEVRMTDLNDRAGETPR